MLAAMQVMRMSLCLFADIALAHAHHQHLPLMSGTPSRIFLG